MHSVKARRGLRGWLGRRRMHGARGLRALLSSAALPQPLPLLHIVVPIPPPTQADRTSPELQPQGSACLSECCPHGTCHVLCVLLLSAACLPRHQVRLRPLSTLHCGVSPHRERRWHIHAACTNDGSRNSQTRAGKYRVCVQGQTKAPGPGTGRLGPNPTPTTKTGCGCGQDTGLPCVLIWKVTHGSTCLVTHWAIRISTHTKCTEPKPAGSHVAHVLSCV